MRPNLVAGAWVGFNDPRVTLRSEHWGQGAHNALHVVGDFMHHALSDGALDSQAEFPSRPGATIQSVLRRAGEALKRWFGFGTP
jgi:penicillin-binding protein 1A